MDLPISEHPRGPGAFSVEDQAEAVAIAAHIAVAVAAAQNLEHFDSALDSRTIIAQACGLP